MANKPTKAEYEGFKKAVANPMTPAPIKQKLQSIIDQYASEYEGGSEAPKEEPKKRGRKPAIIATPRKTSTPRATKKTATDIEQAKAEIKAKTGKTEEECEAIIEQYRSLRTKAQEGKRKAEQASADNKKRVEKLDQKGDLIEGTNVKTADAVIESTAKDVAEKIEQQIEAVEEKAEKEAKAEVAKDKTIKTTTEKKEAVEAKVEKKVKEKTKVIVKKVVIDTSALLTSIATSLGKFDKDSQKEFLIKLRSDIDKLLAKYAFGGMTNGATQVMNVQQSNLSSSSVNPTQFAKGGGVDKLPANLKKRLENVKNRYGVEISKEEAIEAYKYNLDGAGGSTIGYEYFGADTHRQSTTLGDLAIDLGRFYSGKSLGYRKGDDKDFYANGGGIMADGRIVLRTFNGVGGNKNKTYKLIKDDRDSDGKPYYTLIEDQSGNVMAQGDSFDEVNGYANLMSGKFADGGVIGQEIVFDDNGEENSGVIKDITNLGDYIVKADDGRTLLAQRELDVISFGAMRQQGVEQRKKRFGFFGKGGSIGSSAKLKYINDAFASYELQDELREKLGIDENAYSLGDNVVISFAYTDYGGDFLDKVAIEYFKENYPDNTLSENTSYSGENAFVFGEPAQEWIDSTEDYPLGFEDFEDFYYEKMNEAEYESFGYFLDDLERDDYTFDNEEVMSWLMENKGGYYSMTTQGLDFSYSDLTDELLEEGLISKDDEDDEEYARGGGIKDVIVYDNGGESFDRYTIFTPDGSVYGMSENATGFNMYIGDDTEVEKGSHLGKRLKSVPVSIKLAVERRMKEYAKGGLTEHGLREGDKIVFDHLVDDNIDIIDSKGKKHIVDLDKGKRFAKGGKLWIDTKGKGGLKGVKPSRKNTFRNEAVKRGLTSGQLASKVLASPSRYKGINPKSAQLVKNMGVRKQGGSIGDILRNRRGQ